MKYDSIIILGPTASGKTTTSIKLAKILNAEIVNADSMYIYKDLNIGTAKPTLSEMDGVKHHLISFIDPTSSFNVSEYRMHAQSVINDLKNKHILPIIVGGTGLYIDSLINNYSYGDTSRDDSIRAELESELKQFGKEYIYDRLKSLDPISANKLHINDTKRVIRAIEIALLSYSTKSSIINNCEPILNNPLIIGLNCDREYLYNKINKRVDIMINSGLIDEVKELYAKGLNPEEHQSMKGIGYKEIIDYLRGESTIDNCVEKIKQHSRNYAKRQITWFKRNDKIIWFDPTKDYNLIDEIINLIK